MEVVLITGASSGIGYELANYLKNKNYIVYGISRSGFNLEGVTSIKADITSELRIKEVIEEIKLKEGKIDILINNAGMGISGSIESTDVTDVNKIFNVNFVGSFIMSKNVIPLMRENNKGKIINIGSVASEFSIPFQTFYSSSKAALKVFSEGLANEVSPYGIKVTTILPGDIKTSFTKNREKNIDEIEVYKKRVIKSINLMEKDEQNGMSTTYASKVIYKVIRKKNPPITKVIGKKYGVMLFVKRLLPSKLVNKIVGLIYGFKKER